MIYLSLFDRPLPFFCVRLTVGAPAGKSAKRQIVLAGCSSATVSILDRQPATAKKIKFVGGKI
ncbi:hypothetical protein QUB67_24950 [Microcoleus sp. ARI1-A1]|uniref:hypothetical protein n=1 Tax=unclassified Microcoleus TaxID=2642155 RepID=UPI002FD49444